MAQTEERDREEKDRRAANQAQIASELGKIAANWKDIPGSLGHALWLEVAPSGTAKVIVPNILVKEDIEAVRQLRDYLLSATGQPPAATAVIPLGAAELSSRGVVRACGRVERVYQDGGYFIVQTSSANTFNSAYVMTNDGWRLFRVEKRLPGKVSSLFPQGAASVTVGSEVLAPRCD